MKQNELLEGCAENLGVKREETSGNSDKKNNGGIGGIIPGNLWSGIK